MGCYRDKQAGRFVNCRISQCNLSIFHSFEIGAFLFYFLFFLQLRTFSREPPFAWAGWISAPAAGSPLMHDMDDNKDPRAREMEGYSEPVLEPARFLSNWESCGEVCAGKGQVKGVSGCIMACCRRACRGPPAACCIHVACPPRQPGQLPACESNRAQIIVGSARSPTFTAALFAPNVDSDLPESEPSPRLGK